MGLAELPSDLLAATLQFADHTALLHLENVSRRVRDTIVHCDSWRVLAQRVALYANDCRTRSSADWKRLTLLTYHPVSEELSVLRRVRECSSVDHTNESADNTLTRSHCGIGVALLSDTVVADDPLAFEAIAKRLQLECGCARGRPCYWSSASTWGYNTTDYLDYTLREDCLVNSVQLVPYRVFWYPGSPTYSPKRISFALYELGDDGEIDTLVYESMTFSIVKDMKMSNIVTAVAFGGMARDVKRRDTANYQFATVGHRLLQLWVLNPVTGELTQHKIEQTLVRDYTCVQFSPDRESLVAGSSSGDFCVVGVKTRQLVKVVPACSCGVNSILYFAGGILLGGGDGSVLHYNHDFVDTCHVALDSGVVGLTLNAAQNEAVVGTQAGSIFSVRLAFGTSQRSLQARLLSENHSNAVVQIAYAPNVSDRFATVSRDCTIRIWDASDYTVATRCIVGDAGAPTSLHYSLDVLISGWTDGCIRSHSSDSGEFAWSIDNAHTGGVTALVLSHNQRFIVSAGVGGEVRVWDIRKRDLVSHLKEHSMTVTSLALYRDDLHVISCSRDRSLLCWDLRNERRISSHIQRMGGINTVALSADQRLVLSAGQEKRISCWDLRIDTPVTVIQKAHDEEATCIAVAHNLEMFATGGNDRLVKLWDFNTNQLIMDGVGHSGNVRGVAFSPDDRQLVSVGDDGCVFVWNLYTE
ncbi:hypothetical protein JG688_00000722 [Phytophthora aleatoria]|uniref:F-box domain-containing protein n=1 Tax=Phytophthora aleatoria TaxID=2496075 RepID=A0A8J5IWQ0_9STRA|nr:hypothetical protein JG688_00000722 [Phytophthora aleatoria]